MSQQQPSADSKEESSANENPISSHMTCESRDGSPVKQMRMSLRSSTRSSSQSRPRSVKKLLQRGKQKQSTTTATSLSSLATPLSPQATPTSSQTTPTLQAAVNLKPHPTHIWPHLLPSPQQLHSNTAIPNTAIPTSPLGSHSHLAPSDSLLAPSTSSISPPGRTHRGYMVADILADSTPNRAHHHSNRSTPNEQSFQFFQPRSQTELNATNSGFPFETKSDVNSLYYPYTRPTNPAFNTSTNHPISLSPEAMIIPQSTSNSASSKNASSLDSWTALMNNSSEILSTNGSMFDPYDVRNTRRGASLFGADRFDVLLPRRNSLFDDVQSVPNSHSSLLGTGSSSCTLAQYESSSSGTGLRQGSHLRDLQSSGYVASRVDLGGITSSASGGIPGNRTDVFGSFLSHSSNFGSHSSNLGSHFGIPGSHSGNPRSHSSNPTTTPSSRYDSIRSVPNLHYPILTPSLDVLSNSDSSTTTVTNLTQASQTTQPGSTQPITSLPHPQIFTQFPLSSSNDIDLQQSSVASAGVGLGRGERSRRGQSSSEIEDRKPTLRPLRRRCNQLSNQLQTGQSSSSSSQETSQSSFEDSSQASVRSTQETDQSSSTLSQENSQTSFSSRPGTSASLPIVISDRPQLGWRSQRSSGRGSTLPDHEVIVVDSGSSDESDSDVIVGDVIPGVDLTFNPRPLSPSPLTDEDDSFDWTRLRPRPQEVGHDIEDDEFAEQLRVPFGRRDDVIVSLDLFFDSATSPRNNFHALARHWTHGDAQRFLTSRSQANSRRPSPRSRGAQGHPPRARGDPPRTRGNTSRSRGVQGRPPNAPTSMIFQHLLYMRPRYEDLLELAERLGPVRSQGLSQTVLSALPEWEFGVSGDADSKESCVVCMSEYVSKEKVRGLPCQHTFHSGCINRWLKDHPTCPICRVEVKVQ